MNSLDIYPFFIECSKSQPNLAKRKQLQGLAFGRGGLIFQRNSEDVLITPNGEFSIPKKFTDLAYDKLQQLLWQDTASNYYKMQDDIKNAREVWTNVKKKDKLRMIDKYILSRQFDSPKEMLFVKSIITLALILKMIQTQDIRYDKFSISDVNGEFEDNYFDNLNFSIDFATPVKPKLKSTWVKFMKGYSVVDESVIGDDDLEDD